MEDEKLTFHIEEAEKNRIVTLRIIKKNEIKEDEE